MREQRQAWRFLATGIICLLLAQVCAVITTTQRPRPTDDETLREQVPLDQVLADLQPGEFAGTLLLGGFRGLVTDLLWMRAINAKEQGRHYESVALFQLISQVQPRFEQVWEFMSHDMAYNIAHQVESNEEKWAWFLAGVEAQTRGVERNPRSNRLWRYLAWLHFQKGELFLKESSRYDWAPMVNPLLQRFPDQVRVLSEGRITQVQAGSVSVTASAHSFPVGTEVLYFADAALVAVGSVTAVDAGGAQASWKPEEAGALPAVGMRVVERCSSAALAERFYRIAWHLASDDFRTLTSHVRRLIPVAITRDANRRRNDGDHRSALLRYLDALEDWQLAYEWCMSPESQLGETARALSRTSFERNAGRLRERTAWLLQELAWDENQGRAAADAVRAGTYAQARELLLVGNWKQTVADRRGIRWLDEGER